MKPRYVYHGSADGNIKTFEPRTPKDIGSNPGNKYKGVYATNLRKWAMITGIIADDEMNGLLEELK